MALQPLGSRRRRSPELSLSDGPRRRHAQRGFDASVDLQGERGHLARLRLGASGGAHAIDEDSGQPGRMLRGDEDPPRARVAPLATRRSELWLEEMHRLSERAHRAPRPGRRVAAARLTLAWALRREPDNHGAALDATLLGALAAAASDADWPTAAHAAAALRCAVAVRGTLAAYLSSDAVAVAAALRAALAPPAADAADRTPSPLRSSRSAVAERRGRRDRRAAAALSSRRSGRVPSPPHTSHPRASLGA